MRMLVRRPGLPAMVLLLLLLLLLAAGASPASAQTPLPASPSPPCAGAALPAPAALDQPPTVRLWHMDAMPPGWRPAACSGLERRDGSVLVAVTGRFRDGRGLRDVLARLGAVSTQARIVYWSVRHGGWRPMLSDASALASADPDSRRGDFRAEELVQGAGFYSLYDDSEPVGPVVSLSVLRRADASGFVLVSRNITPAKVMGFVVAAPGDIQSMVAVERDGDGDGVFRYYALSSTALAPLAASLVPDGSHINRAVAVYRFVAGIPGDTEPPAATH